MSTGKGRHCEFNEPANENVSNPAHRGTASLAAAGRDRIPRTVVDYNTAFRILPGEEERIQQWCETIALAAPDPVDSIHCMNEPARSSAISQTV